MGQTLFSTTTTYKIEGSSFDASKMINEIMNSEDDNSSLFSNLSAAIFIQIKKTYIDDVYYLNNLIGRIDYKKNISKKRSHPDLFFFS